MYKVQDRNDINIDVEIPDGENKKNKRRPKNSKNRKNPAREKAVRARRKYERIRRRKKAEKENRRQNEGQISQKRRTIVTNAVYGINIALILLVFVSGFVYLLCFRRETVSNEENRNLTKFPEFSVSSYLSGEFTSGIADYYDDTVHGRSRIKEFISSKLLPLRGRPYGKEGFVIYNTVDVEDDEPEQTTAVTTAATTPTNTAASGGNHSGSTVTTTQTVTGTTAVTTVPDNRNPAANGEISDGIVIVNKRGVMLFGGGKSNGAEYAESINKYKESLGDGVNVYSMICPTPVSYYLPENYSELTASEKDNIDSINKNLVNVTPVDAFNALLYHKNENIYFRTDHHWQPLGAYYAAEEFAKDADVPFAPLDEYEKVSLPGFVGTLYGYTKSSELLNNPEDFVYYKPKTEVEVTRYNTSFEEPAENCPLLLDPSKMSNSSYYLVFGGDEQITHVKTQCKNGRTLVIFKDSYGNALLPVLTSSFENIYLCDIRYFDKNAVSFVKEVKATDLLFAVCSFSATGVNHTCIEENRTK